MEPKTARSRWKVHFSRTAVDALKAHRVCQLEERMAALGWGDETLVFPSEIGTPMHPITFRDRSWLPFRKRAGLPSIRFHDLHHTA